MRGALVLAGVVLTLPSTVRATSLVACERRDFSGLTAPWSAPRYAQPEDGVRWSVQGGHLARSTSEGREDLELPRGGWLNGLTFPSAHRGYVVGNDGTVFQTSDGGGRWDPVPIAGAGDLELVTCADEDLCWIVEKADDDDIPARVFRTTDGGASWTASRLPLGAPPRDVTFLSSGEGWAVGEGGAFLRTGDGGATWERRAIRFGTDRTPVDLELVRFVDARNGYVVSGNRLARTTDGGQSWGPTLTAADGLSIFAVAAEADAVVAAVGGSCAKTDEAGGNYRSADGGATWTDVADPDESDEDWETLVHGAYDGPLRAVFAAQTSSGGGDQAVLLREARPAAQAGTSVLNVSVRRHHRCRDVSIGATVLPDADSFEKWAGVDPCGLDPAQAERIFARFSNDPDGLVSSLVARCATGDRVFRFRGSVSRRQLVRLSRSLAALVDLQVRLAPYRPGFQTAEERAEGARIFPALHSGRYDAAVEEAAVWQALLADYEGPLAPKGASGRVEVHLPPGLGLSEQAPVAYPPIAVMARVATTIPVDVWLDPATGRVERTEALKDLPLLVEPLLAASDTWRFTPVPMPPGPIRVDARFVIDPCVRGGQTAVDDR